MIIKFQPQDYLCSISHELMVDPVICEDGFNYESNNIWKWFNTKTDNNPFDTGSCNSPVTGKKMRKIMIPNHKMRSDIAQIKESFNGDKQLDMIVEMADVIKKNLDIEKECKQWKAEIMRHKNTCTHWEAKWQKYKKQYFKLLDEIEEFDEMREDINFEKNNKKKEYTEERMDQRIDKFNECIRKDMGYSNNYIKKCVSFYNDYEKYHRYD